MNNPPRQPQPDSYYGVFEAYSISLLVGIVLIGMVVLSHQCLEENR
jgi:hypothetical protein